MSAKEFGFWENHSMSKREIIDFICQINRSAKPEFLASFPVKELSTYLNHLMEIDLSKLAIQA